MPKEPILKTQSQFIMKSIFVIILFIFTCLPGKTQTLSEFGNNKPEKIFNGKNLDGWYQITDDKGTDKNLFVVEHETIHVYASQEAKSTQSFGAIITEKEFQDYVLTLEYKWGEKKFKPRDEYVRDAGVLIHMFGENIIWPSGIECQIQEGDTGDLWIIKTKASTKVHPMNKNYDAAGEIRTLGAPKEYNRFPRSYCWEKPEWNKIVLVVKGDHAQFYINDKLVNEAIDMKKWDPGQDKWIPLTKGKILLQAEGSEIFYRNISVQDIKTE